MSDIAPIADQYPTLRKRLGEFHSKRNAREQQRLLAMLEAKAKDLGVSADSEIIRKIQAQAEALLAKASMQAGAAELMAAMKIQRVYRGNRQRRAQQRLRRDKEVGQKLQATGVMNIAMDLLRGFSTQDEDSDTTTANDKDVVELAANSWAVLRASRDKFVEQETKPTTPQPTASELAKKMDAVATDLALMSVHQVQPQMIPGMQPAAFDRLEQRMNGMDAKMDKIMQTLENLEAARVQAVRA